MLAWCWLLVARLLLQCKPVLQKWSGLTENSPCLISWCQLSCFVVDINMLAAYMNAQPIFIFVCKRNYSVIWRFCSLVGRRTWNKVVNTINSLKSEQYCFDSIPFVLTRIKEGAMFILQLWCEQFYQAPYHHHTGVQPFVTFTMLEVFYLDNTWWWKMVTSAKSLYEILRSRLVPCCSVHISFILIIFVLFYSNFSCFQELAWFFCDMLL